LVSHAEALADVEKIYPVYGHCKLRRKLANADEVGDQPDVRGCVEDGLDVAAVLGGNAGHEYPLQIFGVNEFPQGFEELFPGNGSASIHQYGLFGHYEEGVYGDDSYVGDGEQEGQHVGVVVDRICFSIGDFV
jgi:hypothetical protein